MVARLALFLGLLTASTASAQAQSEEWLDPELVPAPPLSLTQAPSSKWSTPELAALDAASEGPELVARAATDRTPRWLMVGGGVALAAAYAVNGLISALAGTTVGFCAGSLGCSSGGSDPAWDPFRLYALIPLAGPWAQLATKPTAFGQDDWGPYLIGAGVIQLAGTLLLISGAVLEARGEPESSGPPVAVAPWIGDGTFGLLAAFAF